MRGYEIHSGEQGPVYKFHKDIAGPARACGVTQGPSTVLRRFFPSDKHDGRSHCACESGGYFVPDRRLKDRRAGSARHMHPRFEHPVLLPQDFGEIKYAAQGMPIQITRATF